MLTMMRWGTSGPKAFGEQPVTNVHCLMGARRRWRVASVTMERQPHRRVEASCAPRCRGRGRKVAKPAVPSWGSYRRTFRVHGQRP